MGSNDFIATEVKVFNFSTNESETLHLAKELEQNFRTLDRSFGRFNHTVAIATHNLLLRIIILEVLHKRLYFQKVPFFVFV